MLILIALLLGLIPAVAIVYPFVRRRDEAYLFDDESSTQSELQRQWDAAVAGLKNTELERAIGNLAEDDYRWLREQYMTDAALVMKALEMEEKQEQELLAGLEHEVRHVRQQVLGGDGSQPKPGGAA